MDDIGDSNVSLNHEADLETFRQQWHLEVEQRKQGNSSQSILQKNPDTHTSENLERAKLLFQNGIEKEKEGRMLEAIKFYRNAVQLDPDVESHIQYYTSGEDRRILGDEDTSDVENCDLILKFGNMSFSSTSVDDFHQTNSAFSNLPSEIINKIFHFVVSCQMDMKSLEALSETCRKFYFFSRDDTIWKSVCEKIWTVHNKKGFSTWRNMYLTKPHVRLDGIYISKITYYREGDPTVLYKFYEPIQVVEYYRYVRFFHNGKIIMFTSPEPPLAVVHKVTLENQHELQYRIGTYKTHVDYAEQRDCAKITAKLKDSDRESGRRINYRTRNKCTTTDIEYHLALDLSSSNKKRCNKLTWQHYSCITNYFEKKSTEHEFNLSDQFPPFYFSPVNSYMQVQSTGS
uniref:F-box domain-containing protein n=1 Tax=Ciona savignyi TaxID=51511 RepID=H2ZBV7_CIOSA